jgi:TFIIF-interacting CTD phosphatase-like protein
LVFLDIDQTLVYSSNALPRVLAKNFEVYDDIKDEQLYVYKRPFLQTFLDELSTMSDFIEVATYTAGTQEYADQVI